MKIAVSKPPVFTPLNLTFTVETPAEAQAFYFLCNYVPLIETLGLRPVCDKVRNELNANCSENLHAGYSDFLQKLVKAVK